MPTYEYRCTDCGEHLEVVQSFRDDPLTECPRCSGDLRKVFQPIGIAFKGTGFYRNDARSGTKSPSTGPSSTESSSSSTSDSSSGGDASSSSSSSSSASSSDGGSSSSTSSEAKTA